MHFNSEHIKLFWKEEKFLSILTKSKHSSKAKF